ncbi:SGT1 domain-containing protein [Macrophomina phaseolina MS6]|uniref:SGT1 domain-containing protein n=2 Tax=Macrophomina phaseolina TaxID=35725 RepID=K2RCG9_MACPH|nr:SGT1 domain-containing protein [Macrophomina phaseolina MS6]KAH7042756.1 regulatory factor Sgt1 [Macrophomina phaseolina]
MEKSKDVDNVPQDDFKWFGEGFSGFPKRLPDDTVEYVIYIIDAGLTSDAQIRERLRAVETAANLLCKKLLKDYIWQRESFTLDLKREDGTWLLRGTTNYGDSVADEWLIVYLLREISKQNKDAWIRIYDTDGEFLLIEAANALPKWLNPEVAENRVWINNGQLKILPLEGKPGAQEKRPLTLEEARNTIRSSASAIIHSPMIEEEAFYRIRNYPSDISTALHHALVTIPRTLAFLLHRNPTYVSPAVEAFYLRDPISLKPLKRGDPSALAFPPTDLVTVRVRFTKVGYAQLKSQDFPAPRAWEPALASVKPGGGPERERLLLGMKLACGFDMLVADPQNQDKPAVREIKMLLEDLRSGDEVLPMDEEIAAWEKGEDDDSWMNINYEDFERELAGKKGLSMEGVRDSANEGFGDKAAQENLRKMVERFESFLNDDNAGPEGAELDDMDVDDDDDDEDSDVSSEGEDKAASFDEEEFSKMMREMMGMPDDVYKEIMEMPIDEVKKSKGEQVEARLKEKETEARMFGPPRPPPTGSKPVEELSSDDDEDFDPKEAEEFRKMMAQMESELKDAGALDLDPKPKNDGQKAIKGKGKAEANEKDDDVEEIERSDDEGKDEVVEMDYNLLKNMLEAFKGQGGMAGPAGNMMGMMGVNMPRDEPEEKK